MKNRNVVLALLSLVCITIVLVVSINSLKLRSIKNEFENILWMVNHTAPEEIKSELLEYDWVTDVSVQINSSLYPDKFHDWMDWNEVYEIRYIVPDAFDSLTIEEKYTVIDRIGNNVTLSIEGIVNSAVPNHSRYTRASILSDESKYLQKIYGQTVFYYSNVDIYFQTNTTTYMYSGIDHHFSQNGKEMWVPKECYLDAPVPGMKECDIAETKLGIWSSYENCLDYYKLREDHRSTHYYWRDSSGNTIFEVYVLAGEVLTTYDLRVSPMIVKNKYDE